MFHSRIDDLNRDHILESMWEPNGSVCVLIATIAWYGHKLQECQDSSAL